MRWNRGTDAFSRSWRGLRPLLLERRQIPPAEVPVPRISADPCTRVFQRFELQAVRRNSVRGPVVEKQLAICRHEVRHAPSLPHMAVQPQGAVHGVDHSVASFFKFPKRRKHVGHARARLVAGHHAGVNRRGHGGSRPHEQGTEVRIRGGVGRRRGPAGVRGFGDDQLIAVGTVELQ